MRAVIEPGQRFGSWLVLSHARRASETNSNSKYLCRCDCGKEKWVFGYLMKRGESTSCGCSRIGNGNRAPVVFAGERYTRWLVLREDGRTKDGCRAFLCRCDCGTERRVKSYTLKSGQSRSCGCLHREISSRVAKEHLLPAPRKRGPEHHYWLDTPTYPAMHRRLQSELGHASNYDCVDCGNPANEWSYRGAPGDHGTTVEDYDPRCFSCHKKRDYRLAHSGGQP